MAFEAEMPQLHFAFISLCMVFKYQWLC